MTVRIGAINTNSCDGMHITADDFLLEQWICGGGGRFVKSCETPIPSTYASGVLTIQPSSYFGVIFRDGERRYIPVHIDVQTVFNTTSDGIVFIRIPSFYTSNTPTITSGGYIWGNPAVGAIEQCTSCSTYQDLEAHLAASGDGYVIIGDIQGGVFTEVFAEYCPEIRCDILEDCIVRAVEQVTGREVLKFKAETSNGCLPFRFTWDEHPDPLSTYQIMRNGVVVVTLPHGTTSWLDFGFVRGSNYNTTGYVYNGISQYKLLVCTSVGCHEYGRRELPEPIKGCLDVPGCYYGSMVDGNFIRTSVLQSGQIGSSGPSQWNINQDAKPFEFDNFNINQYYLTISRNIGAVVIFANNFTMVNNANILIQPSMNSTPFQNITFDGNSYDAMNVSYGVSGSSGGIFSGGISAIGSLGTGIQYLNVPLPGGYGVNGAGQYYSPVGGPPFWVPGVVCSAQNSPIPPTQGGLGYSSSVNYIPGQTAYSIGAGGSGYLGGCGGSGGVTYGYQAPLFVFCNNLITDSTSTIIMNGSPGGPGGSGGGVINTGSDVFSGGGGGGGGGMSGGKAYFFYQTWNGVPLNFQANGGVGGDCGEAYHYNSKCWCGYCNTSNVADCRISSAPPIVYSPAYLTYVKQCCTTAPCHICAYTVSFSRHGCKGMNGVNGSITYKKMDECQNIINQTC